MKDLSENVDLFPHRRYNPLNGQWVMVSPQRTQRPWQGQVEKIITETRPEYDPACYLCPGNERAGGAKNPSYIETFVFTNDFAALTPNILSNEYGRGTLMRSRSVPGVCRVVCFSPRHDMTLPEMAVADIQKVVELWAQQSAELGEKYRWVQVFENKGAMMGCSNTHPHGQVWAMNDIPNEPAGEDVQQKKYFRRTGRTLLRDYLEEEICKDERIVTMNEDWVALVPYWAVWPFEMLLLPRFHAIRLPDLHDSQRRSLADILKRLLTRYDNLFETSFPYSMGWHGAPWVKSDFSHWQIHAHFYPPLLRSATVRKFMVGFELLSEPQRDLTAEQAAARLREQSEVHYRSKNK